MSLHYQQFAGRAYRDTPDGIESIPVYRPLCGDQDPRAPMTAWRGAVECRMCRAMLGERTEVA